MTLLSAAFAGPANHAQAINLSSTDYVPANAGTTRFLLAAVAGNIVVDTAGGEIGVTVPIAAGIPVGLRVKKVYKTGTTATGLVALW